MEPFLLAREALVVEHLVQLAALPESTAMRYSSQGFTATRMYFPGWGCWRK